MKLQQLIGDCKPQQVVGNVDRDVTGIEIDSRLIKEGAVFVAMRGTQVDGHSFIGKAIELGAAVVVCERLPESLSDDITYLVYPNCRASSRWEMLRDGIEECEKIRILRAEGQKEKSIEIARKLLAAGYPEDEVLELTGVEVDEL